jgi:hypothetical protein
VGEHDRAVGMSVVDAGWPVVAVVAGRIVVVVGTARVGFEVANADGGTPAPPGLAASGVVRSGGRGPESRWQAAIRAATSTAIRDRGQGRRPSGSAYRA